MKKYSIALLLAQFVASTAIMMTEFNALGFDRDEASKQTEERDLEIETSHETDAFPNIMTFATSLYQ